MTQRGQRAAILLQVVMIMAVLLGFAALTTDYGLLLMRQRVLQNGVDAAALAGGPELGDTSTGPVAIQNAFDYGTANRIPISSVVVRNGPRDLPRTMTVTSQDSVATVFARVLNPRSKYGTVSASATVSALPVTQAYRLRPWGIPYAFFNDRGTGLVHFGDPATLTITSVGNENPNDLGDNQTFVDPLVFGAADPSAGPFPNYIRNCSQGYDQGVSLTNRYQTVVFGQGGDLDSIVAATASAIKNGSSSILAQAGDAQYNDNTWDNPGNSPRVVFLPVIDQMTGGEANILAFAAFYIEGMNGNQISGRFIHFTLPYNGQDPKRLDASSYNYGLYTVRLIK
jgi:hypothetical protein